MVVCPVVGADVPLDSFPVPNSTDRLELYKDGVIKQKIEETGVRYEICNLGSYPMQTQPVFTEDGSAFAMGAFNFPLIC